MVLIVFAEIKILTEISKPCEGAKSNRQQFKKHIQGFAPLICAFFQKISFFLKPVHHGDRL